jgi:RNA polymerase sigma factor (sigma-70 family)
MKFQDDSYYIERVLTGDVPAYAPLVAKHKNLVFSIVLKILNNREDAEEIAQDVFLKAYQSLKTFEKKSKFSTWLYRIAYNTAISKTRKKKTEFVPLEESFVSNYSTDEIQPTMDLLEENEKQVLLDRALKNLPDEDNLLITLFYKAENSVEDIIYITGLTATNVKVRLHRIRRKIQDGIREQVKKN